MVIHLLILFPSLLHNTLSLAPWPRWEQGPRLLTLARRELCAVPEAALESSSAHYFCVQSSGRVHVLHMHTRRRLYRWSSVVVGVCWLFVVCCKLYNT